MGVFALWAIGILCVVTEWENVETGKLAFGLMWTQALHWVAVLLTMNIMLLGGVQQILPSPATSLVLLMLLALGTFLAGLNLLSLPLCLLGVAMALAVPAIAWLKLSVLFLVLGVACVLGLAIIFWPRRAS